MLVGFVARYEFTLLPIKKNQLEKKSHHCELQLIQ